MVCLRRPSLVLGLFLFRVKGMELLTQSLIMPFGPSGRFATVKEFGDGS